MPPGDAFDRLYWDRMDYEQREYAPGIFSVALYIFSHLKIIHVRKCFDDNSMVFMIMTKRLALRGSEHRLSMPPGDAFDRLYWDRMDYLQREHPPGATRSAGGFKQQLRIFCEITYLLFIDCRCVFDSSAHRTRSRSEQKEKRTLNDAQC